MSKQTKKSRYPSRYSTNKFVTAAQYITELICEKKAKQDKKELPLKFWDLPEWNKYYRQQIVAANQLLKQYKEKAVIAALKNPKSFYTYSLRAPFLKKLIEQEEAKIIEIEPKSFDHTQKNKPHQYKKEGLLDKLDG